MIDRTCHFDKAAYLLLFFAVSTIAQVVVPVEKEPMHRLKFDNEFVRIFDVLIPLGKTTLYHTHIHDGISVRISDAQIVDEIIGGETTPFDIRYGDVTFSLRPSPLTHRVVNKGTTEFRNIFIEILSGGRATATDPLPVLSDGHVVLIDNARVRVNRLVLKPGESSRLHTHPMHGLGIILNDGKVEITKPGEKPGTRDVKAGDFAWQKAGTTHVLKNVGSTVFEAVDIELK